MRTRRAVDPPLPKMDGELRERGVIIVVYFWLTVPLEKIGKG
jgi:hypothetical protein